ncbi:inner centromere protein-like [Daktulosphaira vitifoliae]|uniref:inner centromere protein-like n=1 Tax=Daktulosphaira vitifoliae TaxID=58002 RepID=UPI0021A9F7E8|nr:inner centromere protein-like [Daktulosphaira vitifoliae]XP_050528590.1 inner centromere protein-like [Daktulosphaira vitifoliae]
MDSTNLIHIWSKLGKLTVDCVRNIQITSEEQIVRLDEVYNNILNSVQQNNVSVNVPGNKTIKRQSRKAHLSNQVGDLFVTETDFQEPSEPIVRRTKRLASIVASDKIKNSKKSATNSSETKQTRENRARAISTSVDIAPFICPNANSTFVVEHKNISSNNDDQYFLTDDKINTMTKNSKIDDICEISSKQSKKNVEKQITSPKNNVENILTQNIGDLDKEILLCPKDRKREKLEDIDINVDELMPQHMTRIKKRKLEDEVKIIHVPLEKQISTPQANVDAMTSVTPHQFREDGAVKRKELFLKQKADQKKNDELQTKAAKLREEQTKLYQEKIQKMAEEKQKKEENKKVKEMLQKAELIKIKKQAEIRKAEVTAKRKQAEEAKILKVAQKAEAERLAKLNELKKQEKKIFISHKATTSTPTLKKNIEQKTKTQKIENIINNDYGLNDISARDSSEEESRPRKPIPEWAKRENRITILEIQSYVSSGIRDPFFDCPTQINLKQMFQGWNIRERQRTSSAVWTTPPKYNEYVHKY